MDLQPVCSNETIAGACEVLRSAIADVRNLIHQTHSLTGVTSERRSRERA
jgi:hypothetical protein